MGLRRKPVRQNGKTAKKFSRQAKKTKSVNVNAPPMRGGYRL